MAQWTDTSRTMLITEFQKRPILWDRRMNDVNSRISRTDAITKVTQILNDSFYPAVTKQMYTSDDVKQQWKNLKDTFVRKQRWVNEGKYSRDPHEEPSWKFYRLLKFLDEGNQAACSPGSPQSIHHLVLSDSSNSRDSGISTASSVLNWLPPSSTSSPASELDVLHRSAAALQRQQQLAPAAPPLPSTTPRKDMGSNENSNAPMSNHEVISLLAQIQQRAGMAGDGGHHGLGGGPGVPPTWRLNTSGVLGNVSSPLKVSQESHEDTDTTTSPASTKEIGDFSNDSCRALVLPVSATGSTLDELIMRTTFPPTSFESPTSSLLSRSSLVNPNMSVEAALRMTAGGGVTSEPPTKKRKSYEHRMATLLAASTNTGSSVSAMPSPTPTTPCGNSNHAILPPTSLGCGQSSLSPRMLDFRSLMVPSSGASTLNHHNIGGGSGLMSASMILDDNSNSAPTPPLLGGYPGGLKIDGFDAPCGTPTSQNGRQPSENDEWGFFGAYIAAKLRSMATEGQRGASMQLQKSINDLIFEHSMRNLSTGTGGGAANGPSS